MLKTVQNTKYKFTDKFNNKNIKIVYVVMRIPSKT